MDEWMWQKFPQTWSFDKKIQNFDTQVETIYAILILV